MPGTKMADRIERRAQLAELERRAWHLWVLGLAITGLLIIALLAFFYPAVRWGVTHIESRHEILPQLLIGLFTLTILSGVYIVTKQRELNELRNFIIGASEDVLSGREKYPRDTLTGVLDRSALPAVLKHECARVDRYQTSLCLALFDVRDFSALNETQGHLAGDLILKELAATLRQTARQTDAVLRYGPDQFLCFLTGTQLEGGQGFVRRAQTACPLSSHLRGVLLDFGLSVYQMGVNPEAVAASAERDLRTRRAASLPPAAESAQAT